MKKATELNAHLIEQLQEQDISIIEHLGLNKYEVLQVVKEWYTNGMCMDILQNENGLDLEELIEITQDAQLTE